MKLFILSGLQHTLLPASAGQPGIFCHSMVWLTSSTSVDSNISFDKLQHYFENSIKYSLSVTLCIFILLLFAAIYFAVKYIASYRASVKHKHISEQRLLYIRNLIDLYYVYNESPEMFVTKFQDKVSAKEISCYNMFDLSRLNIESRKFDDQMLCILFESGFIHRELCAVFNLKKISSMYVKYHRLKKRLGAGGLS